MVKKMLCLNSIDKVKSFVNVVTGFDFDIDLGSGRYIIDAKSIMGIFSLDLSKNIECTIHNNDADCSALLEAITPYIVE